MFWCGVLLSVDRCPDLSAFASDYTINLLHPSHVAPWWTPPDMLRNGMYHARSPVVSGFLLLFLMLCRSASGSSRFASASPSLCHFLCFAHVLSTFTLSPRCPCVVVAMTACRLLCCPSEISGAYFLVLPASGSDLRRLVSCRKSPKKQKTYGYECVLFACH